MDKTAIRHAATVILIRRDQPEPRILIGQRGKNAAFMPSKFVFPGGALDPADAGITLVNDLSNDCLRRLQAETDPTLAEPLLAAAVREVWEETGLRLARNGQAPENAPKDWQGFFDGGYVPSAHGFEFIFRAITPPGRTRRFDARFFLVDAENLVDELDDFSAASDELSHLQWVDITKMREFDLPFITEVVLAEVQALLKKGGKVQTVPFFYHGVSSSEFKRL
ncbi:MAG: NUDIX hydrolase [Paracoccaceae bacterium]|nr:NUDIX hydrolase [Paracoccaceae bacterium]